LAFLCSLDLATDPEILLMLESRPGKDGPEWQFAFAPMTGFALNAFWKGKPIWSKPAEGNGSARNPSNTFHIRRVLKETPGLVQSCAGLGNTFPTRPGDHTSPKRKF
jgi:hypothetical protein